ncbi:MAG: hypothetical protein GXO15_01945 [Crenarchaeota archaeon]|nr:hypothetical protein [Thermoproteota archaeon]
MQTRKERVADKPAALRKLRSLLECYGFTRILEGREARCTVDEGGCTLYLLDRQLARSLRGTPLFAGVPVALLRGARLLPTLGLLSLAERAGITPRRHYVVVGEHAANLFTYGRDIFEESLEKTEIDESCARQGIPLVVVDPEGGLLGYGAPRRKAGRLLIHNLLDVGWYLRSGV